MSSKEKPKARGEIKRGPGGKERASSLSRNGPIVAVCLRCSRPEGKHFKRNQINL